MTKKNYYLIIPARDIYIKKKEDNIIVENKSILKDSFNNYGVPQEYQKIIIKVSIGSKLGLYTGFELTTNEMFLFKTSILKAILNKKNYDKLEIISHTSEIITDNHLYHAAKVKEFYQELIDNGLAAKYQNALTDIFGKKSDNLSLKRVLKKEYD